MRRALIVLLLAACNPYNPNLGERPFQCGTDEPRCPEGYVAVDVTAIRCECYSSGAARDAGSYECVFDEQEPNDTKDMPFPTDIGENNRMKMYPHSSICPASDEDFFQFTAPRNPTPVKVTTMFDTARKAPIVDIRTAAGVSVPGLMTSVLGPGLLNTTHTGVPMGSYLVSIHADQETNYSVTIEILVP